MNFFVTTVMCLMLMSFANAEVTNPKISVQLWSVKAEVKADIDGTLEALAGMNFDGVEFAQEFSHYENDAPRLAEKLKSLDLLVSGAHVTFASLDADNFDSTISFYKALGCEFLIIGWDERAWHPEGVVFVAQELTRLSALLASHNMKVGFHNHNHEFDGFADSTYWDYIATHTPNSVILQQDVGWITYAGQDPVAYIKKYPGRTLTTHYKVKLPEGSQGKLPFIGQDTINWPALIDANKRFGGTQWLVVEQEEYPEGMSPLEAVRVSKQGLDGFL